MDTRVRRRETLHSVAAADSQGSADDNGLFLTLILAFGALAVAGGLVVVAVPESRGLLALFIAFVAIILGVLVFDRARDARRSRRAETSEVGTPPSVRRQENGAEQDHEQRRAA